MSFYFIKPKDKLSYSRRWVVDDAGILVVKDRYQNYNKDPENITDRWEDFVVEPLKSVFIDFGGMCCTKEPNVKFVFNKTKFEVPITHLPIFQDALACETLVKNDNWCCKIWHFGHVYSAKNRMKLWKKVKLLVQKHRDARIAYENSFNKTIDEINAKHPTVIRQKPLTDNANCSTTSTN